MERRRHLAGCLKQLAVARTCGRVAGFFHPTFFEVQKPPGTQTLNPIEFIGFRGLGLITGSGFRVDSRSCKLETLRTPRREEEGKPSIDWVGLAGLRMASGPSEDGWDGHRHLTISNRVLELDFPNILEMCIFFYLSIYFFIYESMNGPEGVLVVLIIWSPCLRFFDSSVYSWHDYHCSQHSHFAAMAVKPIDGDHGSHHHHRQIQYSELSALRGAAGDIRNAVEPQTKSGRSCGRSLQSTTNPKAFNPPHPPPQCSKPFPVVCPSKSSEALRGGAPTVASEGQAAEGMSIRLGFYIRVSHPAVES